MLGGRRAVRRGFRRHAGHQGHQGARRVDLGAGGRRVRAEQPGNARQRDRHRPGGLHRAGRSNGRETG
ncbi:hypothetical protein G6F24_018529 [Rhizopus arrhizus]|nr:hypothetical protein G6F24_018529 [Rhizopus arrhizus]